MTEQRVPIRPIPAALIVARRAMVVAAVSMVIAALAVVIALLVEPESEAADEAAIEQARADAAAAQDDADAATAIADAATVIAEEAAAKAALAEEALVDALAGAGGSVDPEVIARLEAQLEEARNLAATALVAAETSATAERAGDAAEDAAEGEAGDATEDAAEDATEDDSAGEEDATEEEPAEEDDAPSGDAAPDEPAPEPDDTDTDTAPAADLPGEPSEFGPAAGVGLAVVGIGYNSALNLRDAPSGEIIARLDNVMDGVRDPAVYVRQPDSDDIIATVDLQRGVVATGNTRQLPTTIWHELRVAELRGWSSSAYLAPLGAARDATGDVEEALGGAPTAETLIDLGRRVAALYESSGEVQSRTTISSSPSVFEAVGDITLDVIGLPDDSVRGYRINITADSGAEDWTQGDGGPFTLRSVTVTPVCHSHRGVSDQGTCN